MNLCQVFDVKISRRDIGADPIEDLAFVIDVEHELVNVETLPPTEKSSSRTDLVIVGCNQCGHPVMIRHSDNILYCEKCGPIIVARTGEWQEPKHRPPIKPRLMCSFCAYTTNHSRNLQRHIDNLHTNKQYPCKFCNYKGTRNAYLKTHVKKYHT